MSAKQVFSSNGPGCIVATVSLGLQQPYFSQRGQAQLFVKMPPTIYGGYSIFEWAEAFWSAARNIRRGT